MIVLQQALLTYAWTRPWHYVANLLTKMRLMASKVALKYFRRILRYLNNFYVTIG